MILVFYPAAFKQGVQWQSINVLSTLIAIVIIMSKE